MRVVHCTKQKQDINGMVSSRRCLPWIDLVKKVPIYLLLVRDKLLRDKFGGESEFRVVQKI